MLPFAAAEGYLRLTSDVDTTDLSHDPIFDAANRTPLFVYDESTDRWQIPPSRYNFFRPATFAGHKSNDTRRVFVLGGSTVQGRPYETETAFAQWLQLRLSAADPDHRYEVINCGGVSYASYRVALVLDEVLRHSPDAIVLYTGHNEFLEERSYPAAFGKNRRWIDSLAQRSKLVEGVRELISGADAARHPLPSELTTRLDLIDGMQRYQRDARWRSDVEEHFAITLRRMVLACRQQRVPLIVCVPTSDVVRTPPMKIAPRAMTPTELATFEHHWKTACLADAPVEQRLAACASCLDIDPEHAGAHYVAGRLHWDRGQTDIARPHLNAARDYDVCPLRATSEIVDHILATCDAFQLAPVHCDQLLDQFDANGRPFPDHIPDPEKFVDHVHPSIAAHQRIAAEIAKRLYNTFNIAPVATAETDYQQSVTEHLNELDESYFARAKQRLAGLQNWAAGRAGRLALPDQAPPENDLE